MKKNTNLLLKRLVVSATLLASATTVAETAIKETTQQPPSKVSELLEELTRIFHKFSKRSPEAKQYNELRNSAEKAICIF